MTHPKTIDLFAGAGGLTEGFRQAGFKCLYSNDFNANAVDTFKFNHPDTVATCGPIEMQDPAAVRKALGLKRGELECMVGGPPCQGFSIYAPDRILDDPRNSMFRHYLRFIDEFVPQTLLIENVPGMLSLGAGKIVETILRELENRGYKTECRILLAAHYGAPQSRWRLIFLASRLGNLSHPVPTHFHEARANFTGGATLTYRLQPLDSLILKPAVNLREAISDLPAIAAGAGTDVSTYVGTRAKSPFAKTMRRDSEKLYNHWANNLSKINLERLSHIPQGGAWVDIPFELLPSGMQKAKRTDHTKRYGRLSWDSLACTMLTKCDPHWGAVFHPDQPRTFSVRECARFQTFSDSYKFLGNKASQFEQVGNAVPVFLAKAIADQILAHLQENSASSYAPHRH
jgi:DNA (cytosine-5)-methyltransferase 1